MCNSTTEVTRMTSEDFVAFRKKIIAKQFILLLMQLMESLDFSLVFQLKFGVFCIAVQSPEGPYTDI